MIFQRRKYVMWPTSIEDDSRYGGGGLMAMVRSKFFVAQQVPDLWGHLNPICCSGCEYVITSPWYHFSAESSSGGLVVVHKLMFLCS